MLKLVHPGCLWHFHETKPNLMIPSIATLNIFFGLSAECFPGILWAYKAHLASQLLAYKLFFPSLPCLLRDCEKCTSFHLWSICCSSSSNIHHRSPQMLYHRFHISTLQSNATFSLISMNTLPSALHLQCTWKCYLRMLHTKAVAVLFYQGMQCLLEGFFTCNNVFDTFDVTVYLLLNSGNGTSWLQPKTTSEFQ